MGENLPKPRQGLKIASWSKTREPCRPMLRQCKRVDCEHVGCQQIFCCRFYHTLYCPHLRLRLNHILGECE